MLHTSGDGGKCLSIPVSEAAQAANSCNHHMIDPSLVAGGGCDDNLVCGICTLVLKRPTSGCPQGHTFCEACLVRTLEGSGNAHREVPPRSSCPTCRHPTDISKLVRNRPIENMVLALRVACTHSEAKALPCVWSGLLGELDAHLGSDCPNQPVQCPNAGCLVHMPRRDMVAHASDACTRRPVPCRHCGIACPKDEVGAHEVSCDLAPMTCRHGCGATGLLQKQAAAHEQTCPLAPTPCPCLGCGAIVKRKDMSEHLASYAVEHARAVAAGMREMREHTAAQQQTIDRLEGVVREQEAELSDLKGQLAAVLDEASSLRSQRSTRSLSLSLASLPLSREALRGAAADVGATAVRVKERIALLPADVSRRASRARSAASRLHGAAHPTPAPTPSSPEGGGDAAGTDAAAAADGAAADGSTTTTSAPSSRRPSRERRFSPASATSAEQLHRRLSLQSMGRSLSRQVSRGARAPAAAAADGGAPSPARVAAASATAAAIAAAAAAAAANPPAAASNATASASAAAAAASRGETARYRESSHLAAAWQPPSAARDTSSPRLVVAAGSRSSALPAGMPPGTEAADVGRVNVVIESEV